MSDNENKKQSLTSLMSESNFLVEKIVESDGLLDQDTENTMARLERELPRKVDAYCFVLDKLSSEEKLLREKADQFISAARALAGCKDRLRNNVRHALMTSGAQELKGNDYKFRLQRAKPILTIKDEKNLSPEFIKTTITTEPNKEKLIEAIKSGEEIEGVKLEDNYYVKSYVNKS